MTETLVQKQVRLLLERQCRELAAVVKTHAPAGTSFVLFLADNGEGGNMAYVASMERRSAIDLVTEWLDRQDENADAKSLRELLVAAGCAITRIAREAGCDPDAPPENLLEHIRNLRKKAEAK